MTACDDREIPATVAIAVSSETLDCELVDVNEVINTNTVLASEGEINLCGSFSLKQLPSGAQFKPKIVYAL